VERWQFPIIPDEILVRLRGLAGRNLREKWGDLFRKIYLVRSALWVVG
jgi:hypothetical protein